MKNDQEQRVAEQFGAFIRSAREARGLYQEDIAQMTGLSDSYISAFELGKRRIDLSTAMKLCQVLNVDLNDFLKDCQA